MAKFREKVHKILSVDEGSNKCRNVKKQLKILNKKIDLLIQQNNKFYDKFIEENKKFN
ncbi:hypothetical protein C1645_820193 [Glomus cerebriforme]|uniref:Uncharacterized protein n=1 Tax=Glomus cerebriforme TaxID=658196 RepID=A0A397T313_9GLOM|nr:hypothetical protein C1645_820193 [Glomus cerebriforme]